MNARSCFSKKRYVTEKMARRVAVACHAERGTDLRVYPCMACGGYHLTSLDAEPMMKPGYRPARLPAHERERAQVRGRRRA